MPERGETMKHARFWGTALVLAMAFPAASFAQTATASTPLSEAPPPAEFPPSSFQGAEYVDSAGCLYARGGTGATSIWVPRVTANRKVICGLQPTLASTAKTYVPVIPDAPGRRVSTTPVAAAASAAPARAGRYTPPVVNHQLSPSAGGQARIRQVAQVPRAMPEMPLARVVPQTISVQEAGQRAVAGTLAAGTVIAVPSPTRVEVPKGYRPAWEDGRLNPYAGKQLLSGALEQALIWTQTVPRRLKTESGQDVTSRYNYLVYPYTDYAKQRAALGSGNYVIIQTTAGQEIVRRY